VVSQLSQDILALTPVLLHLHPQLQEDLAPAHCLNLLPRGHADFLQHLPPFADDNPLLRLALDQQRGMDVGHIITALLEFINAHRQGVRHLIAQQQQGRLADQIGRDFALIEIGQLVFGKLRRRDRQAGFQRREQLLQPAAGDRRKGHRRSVRDEGLVRVSARFPRLGRHQVNLVEAQQQVRFAPQRGQQAGNPLIVLIRLLTRIHQEEHDVHPIERLFGFLIQKLTEFMLRGMNAGRVHKNQLRCLSRQDAQLTAAGRLRPRGDGGDLLPQQGVDERGLAHVGLAQDGDETGTKLCHDLFFLYW